MSQPKLMLIDGNSLLYRAFYALPLLHTGEGIFTNGVYGFLTMLNRVLEEEKPTHVVVAFDKGKKTFRNDIYSEYKANRSAAPDELKGQFQLIRETLNALNITYIEMEGFEGDDIIGTLSKNAADQGTETVIVTGDGDELQLVSDKVRLIMTKKGISESETYGPVQVQEKWEVDPEKLIEVKALMGDTSDNIPGVPGVGRKTAVKLIKEFGCLENIYENLDKVSGKKLVERLSENKDQAFTSRQLGTIVRDMDIDYNLENYVYGEPDYPALVNMYKRLEFNNFLKALQEKGSTGQEFEDSDLEVDVLETEDQVKEFVNSIEDNAELVLYIAADYHHPMWAKFEEIYFAVKGQVYKLPLEDNCAEKLELIKPLIESDKIKKYLHNAKFAQVIFMKYGINLNGIIGDTMLLAYVNDPSFDGEKLSAVMFNYLNINIPGEKYALLVSRLKDLFFCIEEQTDPELQALYREVELPLSGVLALMQYYGVNVNRETLEVISDELALGITSAENHIYELAGTTFNINSPKQLGIVLFEDMGLRVIKKTKTGYATGAEILEKLYDEHEIIAYILNYRQLTKLKSTYVDALQGLIHPDTGRVHTIFKQAQTATGRLSSVEPNLQNIPIKMEEGRRIRRAFTVQEQGNVLLSADYSQIDLRSLAHISGDENLIETFKSGIDIHTRTAAEIFKVPLEAVDSDLRRRAKAVNFGIVYGISDFGLSRDTGVSRKEARQYIDNYLDSYPGVRQYMDDIVEFGQKYGYVETILKRRRYLPDLNAKNKMVQSFARRMALNTPIQGTSADIIKLAMIKVQQELYSRHLQARLALQVHDDLILEVPEKELEETALLLQSCMENACTLKVPLKVSLQTGPNWYEMETFTI
ncbi:MAG: DNA polymerase I [Syntrophomonadaceae bacterium]|nr:DNA polymerase I [Syntrophomonadaceae bacterium]MDD3889098.1 DNA polymerase I [Syntrophomonadaceae bacterium]MDD4549377.1 DNA polymerase I [Syntrophomonadaceae bacterium]